MKIQLVNNQCLGDVVVLTAAVRDLKKAGYEVSVKTTSKDVWKNNPNISFFDTPDKILQANYTKRIKTSSKKPYHFITGFHKYLEEELGITLECSEFKPDLHLSKEESKSPFDFPYWVINAGGNYTFTTKHYDPSDYQKIVDAFPDRVFVQIGKLGDWHVPLKNTINLIGKTNVRQLFQLIGTSQGVVCPITSTLHISAGLPKKEGYRPTIVIAGGRESPHWEAYDGMEYLHTVGKLDCCQNGGCWKKRVIPLYDGQDSTLCTYPTLNNLLPIAKCMKMITPERVIEAIKSYDNVVDTTKLPSSCRAVSPKFAI